MILMIHLVQANVKSQTGNIIIDSDADGISNLKINTTGLAIGDNLTPSSNLHVAGNILATTGITVGDNVAGTSTLNIGGSLGMHNTTITSNVTLDSYGLNLVDSTLSNLTITLPDAVSAAGRVYTIKKMVTANKVKINGGGNQIDYKNNYFLLSGNTAYMTLISSGNNWFIIDKSGYGINAGDYSSNLIVHYKMDETSGTSVSDSSGNGNDSSSTSGSPSFVSGYLNNALEFFNGQHVNVPDSSSLDSMTTEMTFAAWVYPHAISNDGLMTKGNLSSNQGIYNIVLISGGALFRLNNSAAQVNIPLSTNEWAHICYTYDGTTLKAYKNGVLGNTTSYSAAIQTDNNNLRIGVYYSTSYRYDGLVDEFRMYNRALSADDISALYEHAE